jgi:hypothetical protein
LRTRPLSAAGTSRSQPLLPRLVTPHSTTFTPIDATTPHVAALQGKISIVVMCD